MISQSIMNHWILGKEFRFEAAHELPHHDGKCARLHGHSWRGVVYVCGTTLSEIGSKSGMVMDYADIKYFLKPLVDNYLDHYFLNKTTGLENPTSEEVARWIFDRLEQSGLPGLIAVRIDETCTSTCVYTRKAEAGLQLVAASDAVVMG
jgi:6-pyruvoyltetrahydropterin/6-carboxytetrahydropterin synthase